MDVVERIIHRAIDQPLRRIPWQIRVNQSIQTRITKAVVGKRDQAKIRSTEFVIVLGNERLTGRNDDSFQVAGYMLRRLERGAAVALKIQQQFLNVRLLVKANDQR